MLKRSNHRNTLLDLEFFSIVSESDRARLIEAAQVVTFDTNQRLFFRSEEMQGLVVLVSGCVKTCAENASGKSQAFCTLFAGDILALSGVVGMVFADYDVTASTPGSLLVIPFEVIRRLMRSDFQFSLLMLERMAQESSAMRHLAESLSLQDATGRLASWLLNRFDTSEHGSGALIGVTQAAIAAEVGTVREVVSRALAKFERDGVISTQDRNLEILKRESLERIAAYLPKSELLAD